MKDIVIYGFGGFATGELTWLIEEINDEEPRWNILGYIDDNSENHGKEKTGYTVLGGDSWLDEFGKEVYCAIGIGNGEVREKIFRRIKDKVKEFPMLISPKANISRRANVGVGSMICSGSLIEPNANIKGFVIVNMAGTIAHDTILEDFSITAPGVHLSGNVHVGKYADIGTGATVIQGVKIGEGCVIGASAAVVRDIPAYCTAVGVPAKVIKEGLK